MYYIDIILFLLEWAVNKKSGYDARSRSVIFQICTKLDVKLINYESIYASNLKQSIKNIKEKKENPNRQKDTTANRKRIAMISAATIGGAALATDRHN